MKYTMSKDGKMRVNLRYSERVTKEKLDELNKQAIFLGYKSYREYAELKIADIQFRLLMEHEELKEAQSK
jgi:hypothetical protein